MGIDIGIFDTGAFGSGDGSGDGGGDGGDQGGAPTDFGGAPGDGSGFDVPSGGDIQIGDPGIGVPIDGGGAGDTSGDFQSGGVASGGLGDQAPAPTTDTTDQGGAVLPDPGSLDPGQIDTTTIAPPDQGASGGDQQPPDIQIGGPTDIGQTGVDIQTGGVTDVSGQTGADIQIGGETTTDTTTQVGDITAPIEIPIQLPPIGMPMPAPPPDIGILPPDRIPIVEPPPITIEPIPLPPIPAPAPPTSFQPPVGWSCYYTGTGLGSIVPVPAPYPVPVPVQGPSIAPVIVNVIQPQPDTQAPAPQQLILPQGPIEVALPGLERVQSDILSTMQAVGQAQLDIASRIEADLYEQISSLMPQQLDLASQANTILGGLVDEFQNAFPAYDSIAQGFADQLTANWTTVAPKVDELLSTAVGDGLLNALTTIGANGAPKVLSLFDSMPGGACVSALVKGYLLPIAAEGLLTDGLSLIMAMVDTLRVFIDAALSGPVALVEQDSMLCARPELMGVSEVNEARNRGLLLESDAYDQLARTGYKDTLITALRGLARRLLERDDVMQLWLRGQLSQDDRDARLQQLGYSTDDLPQLQTLAQLLPTPTDVVSWMLRDLFPAPIATATYDADGNATFSESDQPVDFVSAFGMDLEFPKGALPLFAQLGLSEKYAHQYWQAHWELPSPQQGAEMYQRGFITLPAFNRLLRARGVEPYWRKPFEQIIYNPITRVDIRRIHKLLGKDHQWLVASYRNIGYSPDDAETLAVFTEQLNSQVAASDKLNELTTLKTQIETLYVDGFIDATMATTQLQQLGYPADHVQAFVAGAALKRQASLDAKVATAVKQLYITLHWTYDQAAQALSKEGFSTDAQARLFEEWDIDRQYHELTAEEKQHRELTKTEVLEAFADGLINEQAATEHLAALNYTPEQAALMVQLERLKVAKESQAATISSVQARFVAGIVDRSTAIGELDAAAVPVPKREGLLARWALDKERRTARLTAKEITDAYTAGYLSQNQATQELRREGYSDADTAVLLALAGDQAAADALTAAAKADAALPTTFTQGGA